MGGLYVFCTASNKKLAEGGRLGTRIIVFFGGGFDRVFFSILLQKINK